MNDGAITHGWNAIRAGTDQITGKEGLFRFDVATMDHVARRSDPRARGCSHDA